MSCFGFCGFGSDVWIGVVIVIVIFVIDVVVMMVSG